MSKLELLAENEAKYAQAKTPEEAERLDAKWTAIWDAMTNVERATWIARETK